MMVEALEAAYRRHAAELVRYATVMIGPDDAPDVVTEALLHVFDDREGRSEIRDVRAFLFAAVHRRVIDHERSSTRRLRREAGRAAAGRSATNDQPEDAADAADARAALRTLSLQQRTVVFLTYWAGHTPGEIAPVLGVSEGTVRKQLARARARLREVLDD